MTTEQMRLLVDLATTGCGVVPAIGERVEPLAAIYSRESAPNFAETLAGRDFSLQGLIRQLDAADKIRLFPVPEKDEHLYRSVNEPGDFKERRFETAAP